MKKVSAGKKLIAGNWKMNGNLDDARSLIADIVNGIDQRPELLEACDFVVCPSFVHLSAVRHSLHDFPQVSIGAQNCAEEAEGALTGEVSAGMLVDAGCEYVILGHSERRNGSFAIETSLDVQGKALCAHEAGLKVIICVGETEEERDLGIEQAIVDIQIAESLPASASAENTIIAYEPVWAIGTGRTPTSEDVASMHDFIREKMQERLADSEKLRILYGGSMKPENAADLLSIENVDGGLIGGASLKANDFLAIAAEA